jgi:hypothetical protein
MSEIAPRRTPGYFGAKPTDTVQVCVGKPDPKMQLLPEAMKSKLATPWVTILTEARVPDGTLTVTDSVSGEDPPTGTLDGKMYADCPDACPKKQRSRQMAREAFLTFDPRASRTRLRGSERHNFRLPSETAATIVDRQSRVSRYELCS